MDLIERQAAIDALTHKWDGMVTSVFDVINSLPSTQPELPIKEKCCYCPHCTNCDVNDDLTINQPEPIKLHFDHALTEKEIKNLKQKITDSPIVLIPSAQPQRMRGKWTYGEDEYGIDGYHCDKCGFFVPWDYTHKFIDFIKDYHFCPNCGADMRGEQDG